MDEPRPLTVAPADSAERAAWRSAIAAMLVHTGILSAAARGLLSSLQAVSLPEDDPDRSLVAGVETFCKAMTAAHADLEEVVERQHLELAVPAGQAAN